MASHRIMKGSRLGAVSYETERNHGLAPRQYARYRTANGEEFEVPFADDAQIPDLWSCRNGHEGTRIDGEAPKPRENVDIGTNGAGAFAPTSAQ